MTEAEAQGVAAIVRLLNHSATREVAQHLTAELDDLELADVLDVLSASDLAAGGKGSALLEEAARRLRSHATAAPSTGIEEVVELQQ